MKDFESKFRSHLQDRDVSERNEKARQETYIQRLTQFHASEYSKFANIIKFAKKKGCLILPPGKFPKKEHFGQSNSEKKLDPKSSIGIFLPGYDSYLARKFMLFGPKVNKYVAGWSWFREVKIYYKNSCSDNSSFGPATYQAYANYWHYKWVAGDRYTYDSYTGSSIDLKDRHVESMSIGDIEDFVVFHIAENEGELKKIL